MRMSKELAQNIAREITKKRLLAITKLQEQFDKIITEECEKQVPLAVRKAFKSHPAYIRQTKSVSIHGVGLSTRHYQSLLRDIPEHKNDRSIKMPDAIAATLTKMIEQLEDMRKSYNEMRKEIENSLIALNSFSRIQKELPEAVKYLPKSTSQALMVNLDKTRELIRTA